MGEMQNKIHVNLAFQAWISFLSCFRKEILRKCWQFPVSFYRRVSRFCVSDKSGPFLLLPCLHRGSYGCPFCKERHDGTFKKAHRPVVSVIFSAASIHQLPLGIVIWSPCLLRNYVSYRAGIVGIFSIKSKTNFLPCRYSGELLCFVSTGLRGDWH